MRVSILLLAVSVLAAAQPVTFGVMGGAILTQPAQELDESRQYAVGPYVEVRLPARFAIEGDVIYTRFGTSSPFAGSAISTHTRGDLWQFPILGKYYIAGVHPFGARPFVYGGLALRKIWFTDATRGGRFFTNFNRGSDWGGGAAFGGGVDFKFRRVGIAPEFRYTRWEGRNFPATNSNEAQILVGLHL